jgi:transcriptional regulator with XRE-family HTH domain
MQKADKAFVSVHEKCQNADMSRSRPSFARMLLPRGAGRLRDDLGVFLKNRRQGKAGDARYGTQAQVAAKAGVTRQTLSDIERGAAWPGPTTLDLLLDALDLGWEHVAHPAGPRSGGQFFIEEMPGDERLLPVAPEQVPDRIRAFVEGVDGSLIIAFGKRIRAIRLASELTLKEVARAAGISIALLSRLERAQAPRSRLFRFERRTLDGRQVTVLVILNTYLQAIWSARDIDRPRDWLFSA